MKKLIMILFFIVLLPVICNADYYNTYGTDYYGLISGISIQGLYGSDDLGKATPFIIKQKSAIDRNQTLILSNIGGYIGWDDGYIDWIDVLAQVGNNTILEIYAPCTTTITTDTQQLSVKKVMANAHIYLFRVDDISTATLNWQVSSFNVSTNSLSPTQYSTAHFLQASAVLTVTIDSKNNAVVKLGNISTWDNENSSFYGQVNIANQYGSRPVIPQVLGPTQWRDVSTEDQFTWNNAWGYVVSKINIPTLNLLIVH